MKQTPLRLLPTSSRPERCPSSRCGARPELGAEPLGITAFLATGALDIERGAIAAASVAHILDRRARAVRIPPPTDIVLPNDPRVRDLRVTPHSLTAYDALAHLDQEDDFSARENRPGSAREK